MTARGLRVHVLDLLHAPGARRSLTDSVVWEEPLEVTAGRVPAGADVAYELVAEAHGTQVIVSGSVDAPWEGECRRCLGPTAGTDPHHVPRGLRPRRHRRRDVADPG